MQMLPTHRDILLINSVKDLYRCVKNSQVVKQNICWLE